jgi:hypothetical protein
MDCGANTHTADEYYMVHNELWRSVVSEPRGNLCVGCLEVRLGRELTRSDFTNCLINNPAVATWFQYSERLLSRLNDTRDVDAANGYRADQLSLFDATRGRP